jgi:Head domain of trimeric autotransporter adhesin
MRIILLSIAFLFLAFSAQSQVLKSAGVWYFLDVDSMTARPAVLPNGTELAYVVGTKTVYYWNRNTSTWTAYGSTFSRDSIYFDSSIAGSGTVGDPWRVDSTLFATITGVGDSIAAALGDYLPILGGRLTGTGGAGFVGFPQQSGVPSTPANGFSIFGDNTGRFSWLQPDGYIRTLISSTAVADRGYRFQNKSYTLADSADVASNITSIAANYLATSNGSNLVARNLFDNNTYVGILNNKPFQFGQWTTAGRPSGTTGYTGFNTTLGYQEFYDGTQYLPVGFWGKTGTSVHYTAGNVGIGVTAPTVILDMLSNVSGSSSARIKNSSTGTGAIANFNVANNLGNTFSIGITGSGYTPYGALGASNSHFYTDKDITIMADGASTVLKIAVGGSAEKARFTSTGNLLLGTTTDITGYQLNIAGTGAASFPRGTVAQRPTIAASTTPFRYNTDSTALEYGESVGTWQQLATRAYARALPSSATWLKPQLEAGSVTINAATNADLFINNLDSVRFGKTLIRSSNNGLLILNPDVGASGISAFGSGYHTIINGTLTGSDGGTGNIALGGTATANSSGANFMMALGYSSNTSGQYAIGLGYNADATADDAMAIGRNAVADENREISIGSSNYTKINLNASGTGGQIVATNYGAENKEATDLSKTQSKYIAGWATDGTITDYRITRDTSTSDADFTVTSTLLSTCQELFISAEVTSGATDTVNVILPLPSSTYANKKVYVFGDDDSSTWWVATKTLLGNGLYFDSGIDAKPTAQNYAAVTTTTGISGVTYCWICTRRNSGTWNWVLIQEN